jgi:hypothetical protein
MKTLGKSDSVYIVAMTFQEHAAFRGLQQALAGIWPSILRDEEIDGDLGKALEAIRLWSEAQLHIGKIEKTVSDIRTFMGETPECAS